MKRTITIAILALALVPAAYLRLSACTNYLITKGATVDGSTIITYVADSHTLYGYLQRIPAGDHLEGTMVDVYEWDTGKYLGKIKQVRHTYEVIGNMNEHQVSIGETTWGGREELTDTTAIVDYGSLMFLALQRARTAREAIEVMTSLVAEYGYYSSGESFSIADPNEVWIMDMISKGPGNKGAVWVVRLIPDGYIAGHANHPRIHQFPLNDPKTTLYAPDVISFAREKSYFKGTDAEFSFANAYAPPDFGALRFCESRVWNMFRRVTPDSKQMDAYEDYAMGENPKNVVPLWIKPDRKLSVRDVMELMRDHFEGTKMDMTKDVGAGPFICPYRWRPMQWTLDSVKYINERAVSTQQTGFSFVAQMRSTLPDPIGGVFWFGVDDTYSTVYVPMYCGIHVVPKSYGVDAGDFYHFSWESAFWTFNWVSNWAYTRYCDMIHDIQVVQRELEGEFHARQPEIEQNALEMYKESPEAARNYLTEYSVAQGDMVHKRWKTLGESLLCKYIDGNVKDEKGNVLHPRYPDAWYRVIVKETGDHYKEKQWETEKKTP